MAIKLIVGLQNPGSNYALTRHNAGGWFVEALAKYCGVSFKLEKKLLGSIATLGDSYQGCKLFLPSTFMNLSGQSLRAVCQFYRIQPQEILVAHDELDLAAGRIKLKTGGGHGGHNGLRDIIQQLNTPDFHRLRIGISHPGHKDLVLNYVLGKPSIEDKEHIQHAIQRGLQVLPKLFLQDLAIAMSLLNTDTL